MDIQNLKKLIPLLEKEKGTVHFFAVFERTRRPEHWDILLSADGLLPGRMKSIGYVIDKLKPLIGGDKGMLEIGRVVIFNQDEYFVNEVRELLAWEKTTRLRNEVIGDVSVSRGYILKAPTKIRASSGTQQSKRG